MGFFNLDCIWLVGAARTDADYVSEGTCTDLLDELVLSLDLLFDRQHA